MIVTVKPPGREEYALSLDGIPVFTSALFGGYEGATVPCLLDEEQRLNVRGGRLRIHGETGIVWQGIVTRRPGLNEPLTALGWGWYGTLGRRAVTYCDTSIADVKDWLGTGHGGSFDRITAGGVLKVGQAAGSTLAAGAMSGFYFWNPDVTIESLGFSANVNHADVSLEIWSSDTEGNATTQVYTKTATGAQTGQTAALSGKHGFVIVCEVDVGPSAPSTWDKWVSLYDLKIYGTTVTNPTTHNLIDDILGVEIDTDFLPAGAEYLAWITAEATTVEPCVFDSCDANTKLREIARYAACDFGWYTEYVAGQPFCLPHWTPRSTTPDYIIRIEEAESHDLDEAALDELASAVRVKYSDTLGRSLFVDVVDTDPTHPLVAAGISRYDEIDVQTSSSTTAQAIGALFLADNGRAQLKGTVTTRLVRSTYGAEVYPPDIRPGKMARVLGLADGQYDCIVKRVSCTDDSIVTIELDNAPYRLDIALARLAMRK